MINFCLVSLSAFTCSLQRRYQNPHFLFFSSTLYNLLFHLHHSFSLQSFIIFHFTFANFNSLEYLEDSEGVPDEDFTQEDFEDTFLLIRASFFIFVECVLIHLF